MRQGCKVVKSSIEPVMCCTSTSAQVHTLCVGHVVVYSVSVGAGSVLFRLLVLVFAQAQFHCSFTAVFL